MRLEFLEYTLVFNELISFSGVGKYDENGNSELLQNFSPSLKKSTIPLFLWTNQTRCYRLKLT